MLRRIVRTVPGIASLAAGLLLLCSGGARAQVVYDEVYLRAEAVSQTMPDGRVVPMWGFALTDATFTAGAASVPGQPLTVTPGRGLKIHLMNLNVPEGVSVVIPGQAAPTDGVNPPQIVRNADGRARAFTHEAATGATADYVWDVIRPGTYLYQSGSHPAVQVQMGLFGALECDADPAVANVPYPGQPAYTQDLVLVYSEIDPALHDAVAGGQYGPGLAVTSTMEYEPKYFLINGTPFTPGLSPVPLGAPGTTLLRFVNGGLETHLPVLGGGSEITLIAEDGNLAPFPRQTTQVELTPGKTVDATLVVPGPGYYPLYDRKLALVNDMAPDGGMLMYLSVPDASTVALSVTKVGQGSGRVVSASAPGGIDCGLDCTETYNLNTEVTLRGLPDPGSLLIEWLGGGPACAGMGDCVTTADVAKTVAARFRAFSVLQVMSPSGGDSFPERSIQTIRWGAPAAAMTFTLHYRTTPTAPWVLIDRGIPGNSFVWQLPGVSQTRNNAQVRVRAFNANRTLIGTSMSGAFQIVNVP